MTFSKADQFSPGNYQLPKITTPDTPWYLRGNISTVPPPAGVTPNFDNPENLHIYNTICQSVCLSVATLLVLIRIYTKVWLLKIPGWEDWTCLIGWVGLCGQSSVVLMLDRYGGGIHLWNVKGDDFTQWSKLMYICSIIYGPIMFAIKLAILLLYLRVFQPVRGTFIAMHIILWMGLLIAIVGTFVEVFQCSPIRKVWWPLWPGTCVNQKALQIASCVFNIVTDFAVLVLPIASVWNLRTSKRRKFGLFCIFGFGVLGCAFSCLRLANVMSHSWWDNDATWRLYTLQLWTTAEMTCGLVCGCLPALPAFFRHMPRIKISIVIRSRTRTSKSSGYKWYGSSRLGRSDPSAHGQPVIGSIGSEKTTPKPKREIWDELDDLEYQGGDEFKDSSPSIDGFPFPNEKESPKANVQEVFERQKRAVEDAKTRPRHAI